MLIPRLLNGIDTQDAVALLNGDRDIDTLHQACSEEYISREIKAAYTEIWLKTALGTHAEASGYLICQARNQHMRT